MHVRALATSLLLGGTARARARAAACQPHSLRLPRRRPGVRRRERIGEVSRAGRAARRGAAGEARPVVWADRGACRAASDSCPAPFSVLFCGVATTRRAQWVAGEGAADGWLQSDYGRMIG